MRPGLSHQKKQSRGRLRRMWIHYVTTNLDLNIASAEQGVTVHGPVFLYMGT